MTESNIAFLQCAPLFSKEKLKTSVNMIKQMILHIILKNLEYFSNKFKHAKKTMFYKCIEKSMDVEFVIVKAQEIYIASLKVVSATFLLVSFLRLKQSTCETRKNKKKIIFLFLRETNFNFSAIQIS